MRPLVVLICALLVLKVRGQTDAETQSSTFYTSDGYDTELDTIGQQTTPKDNYSLRKAGRLNSQIDQQPAPRYLSSPSQQFGARIQQQNAGFESPLDQYSINWTNSEDSYVPSEQVQYPQSGGYPGMMYYPPALNYGIADSIRYTLQGEPIGDFRNLPVQSVRGRINVTTPPVPVYPDVPFARINRRNRFPVPLVNVPSQNFFLTGDVGVRDPGNALPFAPYPFQQMFYPQPIPNSDEDRVDIYMRPPYVDRESGSDIRENLAINKEIPIEQPISPPVPNEEEVAAPAEQIPVNYNPQRPVPSNTFSFNIPPADQPILPISPPSTAIPPQEHLSPRFLPRTFPFGSFPFGIPPQELAPPVPFQTGDVPPAIPPPSILPNLPPAVDENLLASVLSRPQPPPVQPAESGVLPEGLPPVGLPSGVENIPAPIEGQIDEISDNDAKIPYEFGYSMNDGLGTDQHRKEVSDGNGAVSGSYGYRDPFGVYRVVNYVADKNGFRAFIQSNEPGVANPGSADVTVVAEHPPPKAIAEGLRTLSVNAVEVPDVPLAAEPEDIEKPIA